MEIKLNSGVKINTSYLMDCDIVSYFSLEEELHCAKTGEICNSRIQMRITTHALANNFSICLLLQVWDDRLGGKVYFTEYHPSKEASFKRKEELLYGIGT